MRIETDDKNIYRYNNSGELTRVYSNSSHYPSVRSKKQDEAYRHLMEIKEDGKRRKGRHYVNCFDEPIKSIIGKTKGNELGALYFLLHYMQLGKEGLLLKDGKPMTIACIAHILGLKERRTKEIITKLADKDIIVKGGTKRNPTYSINRDYFLMGAFKGDKGMFSKLYQMQSRSKLNQLSLEDADILLRILPWFHFQKYYLCSNPYQPDPDQIHHLNITELAEKIELCQRTLSRHINSLIKAGYIVKTIGIGNAYFYKVNPDIMTRERNINSQEAEIVRQDFMQLSEIYKKQQELSE